MERERERERAGVTERGKGEKEEAIERVRNFPCFLKEMCVCVCVWSPGYTLFCSGLVISTERERENERG